MTTLPEEDHPPLGAAGAPAPPQRVERPDGPGRCRNCETVLHGPFCAACGQEAHGSARSMGTLLHDAWHVLTHVDGRLWRTLGALAFRPGLLTRDYLEDRRARWLPPFRLYLVLSLIFFALAASGSSERAAVTLGAGEASAAGLRKRIEGAARGLQAGEPPEVLATARAAGARDGRAGPGAACAKLAEVGGARVGSALAAACERAATDGGRALRRAFLANVPKTMFFFLPVVALVLFLLFGRSRRYYVEHLVLVLHLQSALFLVLPVALAAEALAGWLPGLGWLPGAANAGLLGYAVWYVHRALREVYGEGSGRTIAKLLVLAASYFVLLGATLVGTAVWSALAA